MTIIALFIPIFALIVASAAHIRSANRVKRPALRFGGRTARLLESGGSLYRL